MYLIIILLPLISFLLCSCFGRKIGVQGSKIVSNFILFVCLISSYILFYEVIINKSVVNIYLFNWFNVGLLDNTFSLSFDNITCSMLILIATVSFFVHLFSTSYMENDPHLPRFMSYLSLFTFFMIVLVTSSNIIQLFIGWEGVGLCSYLLINFWYTRLQANKSAIKAMLVNKIGDVAMILAMILIWKFSGAFDYYLLFSLSSVYEDGFFLFDFIAFLLLIGVIGKSAQIGLHMWLPDAMEGPTPVSALIHAATMVTAGVFLIIRLSPLFEKSPNILLCVVLIGSLTAFFSSTIGLCQNDVKKVIAYSTCSQLGYMVMICGFSYYKTGLFHLVNHGFFKALLFLSAGSIIHSMVDEQDMRRFGGLRFVIPFSYLCIIIGSMSLMGLPFLTGFYSKDLLLEMISGSNYFIFSLWLGWFAAFFTSAYSLRLIYWTFFDYPKSSFNSYYKSHEGLWNLLLPLFILLLLSITGGFLLQNYVLGDFIPIMISENHKWTPFILSLIGASTSIILSYKSLSYFYYYKNKIYIVVYSFFNGAWYFDRLINYYIALPISNFGFNTTYKLIDNQFLESVGPSGTYSFLTEKSNNLSKFHLGRLSSYTFIFLIFIISFLFKL